MKIETLKKSHLKRNIIIGVIVVTIISAVILNFTKAKYRVAQSIPLVNGTINYSLPDLNIVGLYIDGEEATELDSSKTYTLDTTQSTCTYKDGIEIENLNISYNSETGGLSISPFTTKGTKCTLYFNEKVSAKDTLLANYPTVLTRTDFSTTITNTTTGTIYYADTSKGRTYYFAGNPMDNWISFADFYWRIIRINEDGSLKLIYSGNGSSQTTGLETQAETSVFNNTYRDNMYVGYMYENNQVHGLSNSSTIKEVLDTWYQNNLKDYADKIDGNAGFCGDRTPSTNIDEINNQGGTGTTTTYYGYIRLITNKQPTFECKDEDGGESDLYTTKGSEDGNKALTYPIGLITADEVAYAGGVYNSNNRNFYLYTNSNYWTLTPDRFIGLTRSVFIVNNEGMLNYGNLNNSYGVRPVINLNDDITLSGSGTATDPYTVN